MSIDGWRRASYRFLLVAPVLAIPLAGARPLRVPGVQDAVGVILFAAMAAAVWRLAGRSRTGGAPAAAAGACLVAPFALVALLWVGLGTPWDATAAENVMRYEVLLAGAVLVAVGMVLLAGSLQEAGDRLAAPVGLAAGLLAGAAYVVWISFQLGAHAWIAVRGPVPESVSALGDVLDTLLFAACATTYLATAAFAAAMGRTGWLTRGASRAFVIASLVAFALLALRGLSFPDPSASVTPWYLRPGFVAGIPAIPWVMPYLMGVVALRRAGEGTLASAAPRRIHVATPAT